MKKPPERLGEQPVVEFTPIDSRHGVLSSTTLEVAGAICGPAAYLAICSDEDETGYYLFFCDSDWRIWNDLWFEDVEDAKEYVETTEYVGSSTTWEIRT